MRVLGLGMEPRETASAAAARQRLRFAAPKPFVPGSRLILTCGIFAVLVTLAGVLTYLDGESRRAGARDALEERGRQLATAVNTVVARPLIAGDDEGLRAAAAMIWAQPDIENVKFLDRDAGLRWGPESDQSWPKVELYYPGELQKVENNEAVAEFNEDVLVVTAPVLLGGDLVGGVQIVLKTDRIDAEVAKLLRVRILETAGFAALGILLVYALVTYFWGPIGLLIRATQLMSAGDLSTRVDDLHGDMGDLGVSFNTMAERLELSIQNLHESRTRIVEGEENLKKQIASHLHGPVQGHLLALRAELGALASVGDMPASVKKELGTIVEDMGQVIQRDLSMLSRRLYPAIVRQGLLPALLSLGDEFGSSLDIETDFDESYVMKERANRSLLPESSRLAAFRITEEAITNVLKHCLSRQVLLSVRDSGEEVVVSIRDDGPGFDATLAKNGLGLASMQDQAEAAGGSCQVYSSPGQPTEVTATFAYNSLRSDRMGAP